MIKHPIAGWQPIAAWHGGAIRTLACPPNVEQNNILLAATTSGLFRSIDSGQSWQRTMQGIDDPGILTVAFANDSLAFASSPQGRLYHSEDGGNTWHELTTWAGLGIAAVIIPVPLSPASQDRSLPLGEGWGGAKTGGAYALFIATAEGIFRSLDEGQSWEEASFGLLDLDVLCLIAAPDYAQSQTLWAGTAQGGLFRTRNAGRAWRESGIGLPDCAIQSLALSPSSQGMSGVGTLFVGTESDGVYRSTDGGQYWSSSGLRGRSVNALSAVPDAHAPSGYRLLAGAGDGLYRSEDGGRTWHQCLDGLQITLDLTCIASGQLWASTYPQGLYRSSDQGQSWQPVATTLSAHAPPIILPSPTGTLYALDELGTLAVFTLSPPHRVTLSLLPTPDGNDGILSLALGSDGTQETLFAATWQGLYRSHNPSDGWQPVSIPLGEVTHLATSPGYAIDHTLVAINAGGQLARSEDGGKNWQQCATPWQTESILQVCISPFFTADRMILVITASQSEDQQYAFTVWQTMDAGETWDVQASFASGIPSLLAALPVDPHEHALFLATQHRLIKLFTNPQTGEMAVEQFFFDESERITALTVSPRYEQDHMLFVATNQGVYRSTDGGVSWGEPVVESPGVPVVSLVYDGEGLRAVTLGGVVWEIFDA